MANSTDGARLARVTSGCSGLEVNMEKPAVRSRTRTRIDSPLPIPPNFDLQKLRLFIDYVVPEDLKPPRRELRKHGERNLKGIEASVRENGFIVPILIDKSRRIISGYGRWLAAKNIGCEAVPIIEVSHLTEEQIRIFTISDNKLAETSEWNLDELRVEFQELSAIGLDLDMDLNLELTGFRTTEIDNLLSEAADKSSERGSPEDDVPELARTAVARAGNVWELGPHRLICGSSLELETFERLLGEERAQMIFSDAPYNVPATMIGGLGKRQHADFAMASGEMSPSQFTDFLGGAFTLLAQFSVDGSIHFQCMDWRHMREMLDAGYQAYSELKNLIVWKKHSAGMGSFYRSHHELVFAWKNGTAPHINNFGLGDTGRYRTNIWEYRGNAGFHKERDSELACHATVKPWSMVADAIRDCSKRGGIVLDPFAGSGTTLIAAERTGRKARLIELDTLYCDVTIRRWQKLTGKQAVLVETGDTFDELERVTHCDDENASCCSLDEEAA